MTKAIQEVLSVEAVREAYRKTGLLPRAGIFVEPICGQDSPPESGRGWCGCPASAVAIGMGVRPIDLDDSSSQIDLLAETFDLEPRLVRAFTEGVDRRDYAGFGSDEEVAYALGRDVREALGLGEAGTK